MAYCCPTLDVLDELSLYALGGGVTTQPFLSRFAAMASESHCAAPTDTTQPGAEDEARRFYGHVISFLLTQLVRANALSAHPDDIVETFSCPPNKTPSISINDYVQRIMKYTPATKELYLASLVYVDRTIRNNPGMRLSIRNVHRLYMISVVVASKFLDDLFYTNKFFASVAGLATQELNALEVSLLVNTRFELTINPEEFESYRAPADKLARLSRAHGDLSAFFREAEYRRRAAINAAHQQQQAAMFMAQSHGPSAAQYFLPSMRLPRVQMQTRIAPPVARSPQPMDVASPAQAALVQQSFVAPEAVHQALVQPQPARLPSDAPQVQSMSTHGSASVSIPQASDCDSGCATPSNVGSPAAMAAQAGNRKRTLSCSRPADPVGLRRLAF